MCHDDRGGVGSIPDAVRIPRPLRNLLASGEDGLRNTCRHAWDIAAAKGGRWTGVDPNRLLGSRRDERVVGIDLRTRNGPHLDVTMFFQGDGNAIALGRRVIIMTPTIPETLIAASIGRSLLDLVDVPFFGDRAIVIQRIIGRVGGDFLDVRCRCPSNVVDIRGD